MAEMTPAAIVESCKANGGYAAPRLNDQLYLHCKGYTCIQNLAPYVNAKVLWLEQNAISSLEGLDAQQELVSLFVQNNTILSLESFGMPLHNLRVLNISHNYITSLQGLAAACPGLETLQASYNRIASLEACEDLFPLAGTLTSVDLSFNRIEADREPAPSALSDAACGKDVPGLPPVDDDVRVVQLPDDEDAAHAVQGSMSAPPGADPLVIVRFFQRLPNVSVIYLQGNCISHGLKHYRRNMILHLPGLTYLDERPVFADERRVVEAWGRGGADAEAAARTAIREAKREHLNSCVRVLSERMEGSRELRDRLTKQWDAKRAEELESLAQQRRERRAAQAAVESLEQSQRETVEKLEQDGRWEAEDAFADALAPLRAMEARHRHEYEQAVEVEAVTSAAMAEIASEEAATAVVADEFDTTPAPTDKESILAELMRSDEDVLREMEEEMDRVLHSVGCSLQASSVRKTSQSLASTASNGGCSDDTPTAATGAAASLKCGERAVHAAVEQTAARLRGDSAARTVPKNAQRSVWELFDQWEKRQHPHHQQQQAA